MSRAVDWDRAQCAREADDYRAECERKKVRHERALRELEVLAEADRARMAALRSIRCPEGRKISNPRLAPEGTIPANVSPTEDKTNRH
jgi:hypothetical protein